MAMQNRWRSEDRRDWRNASDDWRRNEDSYRSGRQRLPEARGYPDRSRDSAADDVRRRRAGDYGGTGREYSGRSDDDWFGSSYDQPYGDRRPGGIYGPGEDYGTGTGSGYYDRDEWGRGFGLGWQGRDHARGGSGRGSDYGRSEERGFWDRASDELASWFGDRDAERRREQDQFRGRGPKGYTRSDERIREDVSDRLTDDPHVDASNIEVSVAGGEVTLSGTVPSRDQRRRAEDCAEYVSGVTYVQNNIRVKEQASPTNASIGEMAFGREASDTSEAKVVEAQRRSTRR